jgi:hypothetical protein
MSLFNIGYPEIGHESRGYKDINSHISIIPIVLIVTN